MEENKTKVCFRDLKDMTSVEENSIFINLKKYIKDNYEEKGEENDVDVKMSKLIIAFARMEDLHNNKTYLYLINKATLRNISDYQTKEKVDYNPLPIIIIGLEDFTKEEDPIVNALNLDQRVKFFDSSIWHRYIPLNKDFIENFKMVIEEITDNQKLRLYQTSVAREFLEFKTRMMVNSYLAPVGAHAHATHLIPYKFHSESLMKIFFDKEMEEIKEKSKNLRWKFLLIDDYALKRLALYNGDENNKDDIRECNNNEIPTKACIIKRTLEEVLGKEQILIHLWNENWYNDESYNKQDKKIKIGEEVKDKSIILCVKSINEAEKALKTEMFDIIFLDYLLGDNNGKSGRELGSELLKKIKLDDDKLRKNRGPFGKFWIFPISAFSYAMMDDLRESGLNYSEEYWQISAGSDPINTPWLFRYKLIKFLKKQMNMLPTISATLLNLEDKLNKLKKEESDENMILRKASKDIYPEVVKKLSNAFRANKDTSIDNSKYKGSFLSSFLLEKNNLELWEHFFYLIHLIAFSSGMEWQRMWEEFMYIKNSMERNSNNKLPDALNRIKDYIMNLQKQYR